MSRAPEGAQLSEDGRWWWDEQQWQPVTDESAEQGAAGGDERQVARVEQGLPASLEAITDEQRKQFMAEPAVTVEAVDTDHVEVLAMQGAGPDGEATA
jgi:hypothetical protein